MPFSLSPKDSSFYPLFTASAENLVAATEVLGEFVHDHARRKELAGTLRDLEHTGDQSTHAIFKQLNTSFVTPFDREDIYRLASNLDDVMDFVEAAADLVVLTGLGTRAAGRDAPAGGAAPASGADDRRGDAAAALAEGPLRLLDRGQPDRERGGQALPPAALAPVQRRVRRAGDPQAQGGGRPAGGGADAFEHVANVVETISVKES